MTGSAQALTLQPVGGGFDQPIYVSSDPSDAGRLFVAEREGTIKLVENGVTSEFADLGAAVDCGGSCEGERGLMSIALAPDFATSGRLFAAYANDLDGEIHVDELVSTDPGHRSADPSTRRPLASIPHPEDSNHNGGQIQVGPDGYLYLSTGDGGGSNGQYHHAQDPTSPLGKILRIDPRSPAPYVIWSLGLRNPFRFSFDRLSGDMVIGDVGQGQQEEIDLAPSPLPGVVGGQGANYGWNCREGSLPGPPDPDPQCAPPPAAGFVDPVFAYSQEPLPGGDEACAIIGGYVVRDPGLGDLYGRYLYGDLCLSQLRSLNLTNPAATDRAEPDAVSGLNSFGEDSCGRIYVVEGSGRVSRLAGPTPTACPAPAPPPPPAPPQARSPLRTTFVGIKPQRRRVERGRVALLTVWVSPCDGRRGEAVGLLRNGRPNGTKFLSRACTARFLPRVRRGTTFAAFVHQNDGYLAGESRRVKIRPVPHRRRN